MSTSAETAATRSAEPVAADVSPPSRGLGWASVMLALILSECALLLEVVFFDSHRTGTGGGNVYVAIYLGLVALTALLQAAGIFLVVKGRYRVGGALQIAASCLHVLKGEGLIGVVGGLKARAYGRADAEPPAA